jgi:tetratricopeptide (TPR) repeat protein
MLGLLSSFFGFTQTKKNELVLKEENHNEYYRIGTKLIEPYLILSNKSPVLDKKAEVNIIEGIRYLDAVTQINPLNFAAFFIKGKGYQTLEQHENAYFQFEKSFQLNKENSDVSRELMLECVSLGKGKEAVKISLHALTIDSTNSGLIANLALSYLINGDLKLANEAIDNAILIDPIDPINNNLKTIIEEVISGKRARPMKYDDLTK